MSVWAFWQVKKPGVGNKMIWSLELSEFDIDIMHSSDIASCTFALSRLSRTNIF